ncbi:MAG TPA: 4-amino-4-deoxy-L-arabinose-phospho-UDP flippase [Gammaproteobacteria bacterium]|nr:4-amino-4-deoxy-L-arabinose-phospho-UDP flippase [Gammaproteobacteria bacterium]
MSGGTRGVALAALAASIVLSAAGQLGMKLGMRELHAIGGAHVAAADWAAAVPAASWTGLGLASYVASLLAWLLVLARYPLSYAYPLLGLSYVLVYVCATRWPVFGESATPLRTFGTLLVVAGVVLVSTTRADRTGGASPH